MWYVRCHILYSAVLPIHEGGFGDQGGSEITSSDCDGGVYDGRKWSRIIDDGIVYAMVHRRFMSHDHRILSPPHHHANDKSSQHIRIPRPHRHRRRLFRQSRLLRRASHLPQSRNRSSHLLCHGRPTPRHRSRSRNRRLRLHHPRYRRTKRAIPQRVTVACEGCDCGDGCRVLGDVAC